MPATTPPNTPAPTPSSTPPPTPPNTPVIPNIELVENLPSISETTAVSSGDTASVASLRSSFTLPDTGVGDAPRPQSPYLNYSSKIALSAVAGVFNSYVESIGGLWSRFFYSLAWLYIESNDNSEIDNQYDCAQQWLQDIRRHMRYLETCAEKVGDLTSLDLGWSMVEHMGEISRKLRDLLHATKLGSNGFRENIEDGTLTW
ncbi:hypothetical protein GYMLUDRAFT_253279 [Collybiopsis luxurians FD-317 M1]|uniref:Uncharacterized protein n=1 Tax=Collybiopsis luxurians FD-317 M1 TaxID=944289 RepID=A0A0D0C5X6_9AGAR|nr:hypothetical protein GYMLUDRAFT_253279 [Collybiopsis luxurians FD-317 M1]